MYNFIYSKVVVGGVSTDSRKIAKGSVFFALKGETFDGNMYAKQALESGAAYCVVDNREIAEDERYIVVENTLNTLQEVAIIHRRILGIPILAITGSNGKTTTKELVSRVLARKYKVGVTQGNLNNHIGVPLTILAMDSSVEFGVVEMGANHCGEIRQLCSIALPDYGIITNIGKAHLEGFGGEDGIMRGKGELYDYLEKRDGVVFYLRDSDKLSQMITNHEFMKSIAYSARDFELIPTSDNTLTVKYNDNLICSQLVGDYNRFNIAAALAVADYFEIPLSDAISAIESYAPDNGRSQRKVTQGNILYMDAYNANPSSMRSALENFAQCNENGYKKALILGDMRELGEYATTEHQAIADFAKSVGAEKIFFVGENFSKVTENAFKNIDILCEHLSKNRLEGYVVLVKGSRGERLEKAEQFL